MFETILEMSFTASFVIICVVLLRLPLKKLPKIYSYSLWGIVLFRLLCPFSFESNFSVIPQAENSINNITIEPPMVSVVEITTPLTAKTLPKISQNIAEIEAIAESSFSFIDILSVLWLIGVLALWVYGLLSFIKMKERLILSEYQQGNIYICDSIKTAFLVGVFNPTIYLPTGLTTKEREYVLLHEQTHIKRYDHIIKLISFFTLCIHWFNPLVWLAFTLSNRDMEMSCDESVIEKLGSDIKKSYSYSLLSFASNEHRTVANPLAFAEGETKSRIKNILSYKKPVFWITMVAVVVLLTGAVSLISNPLEKKTIPMSEVQEIIRNVDAVYNLSSEDVLERVRGEEQMHPVDKYGLFNHISNYDEVIPTIFTENGQNILENSSLLGGQTILKEDGRIYRAISMFEIGAPYFETIRSIELVEQYDNKYIYHIAHIARWSLNGTLVKDITPGIITRMVIVEIDGDYLVDEFIYPADRNHTIKGEITDINTKNKTMTVNDIDDVTRTIHYLDALMYPADSLENLIEELDLSQISVGETVSMDTLLIEGEKPPDIYPHIIRVGKVENNLWQEFSDLPIRTTNNENLNITLNLPKNARIEPVEYQGSIPNVDGKYVMLQEDKAFGYILLEEYNEDDITNYLNAPELFSEIYTEFFGEEPIYRGSSGEVFSHGSDYKTTVMIEPEDGNKGEVEHSVVFYYDMEEQVYIAVVFSPEYHQMDDRILYGIIDGV